MISSEFSPWVYLSARVSGLVESEKIGCSIDAISERGATSRASSTKEIAYRVTLGEKKLRHNYLVVTPIRTFRNQNSHYQEPDSPPAARPTLPFICFAPLGTGIRTFRNRTSHLWEPKFAPSGTGRRCNHMNCKRIIQLSTPLNLSNLIITLLTQGILKESKKR